MLQLLNYLLLLRLQLLLFLNELLDLALVLQVHVAHLLVLGARGKQLLRGLRQIHFQLLHSLLQLFASLGVYTGGTVPALQLLPELFILLLEIGELFAGLLNLILAIRQLLFKACVFLPEIDIFQRKLLVFVLKVEY